MNNFHNHLTGAKRLAHFRANRFFTYSFDKVLGNRKAYVRFKQSESYFTHDGIDIGFGQRPTLTKSVENALQFISQPLKHDSIAVGNCYFVDSLCIVVDSGSCVKMDRRCDGPQ